MRDSDSSVRMFLVSIQEEAQSFAWTECRGICFRGWQNELSSGAGASRHYESVSCVNAEAREGPKMIDEDRSEEISSDERRQYDRSRVIVDVRFDGGDATGVASSKDISMGGLYMSTQADIPVGETLALRIPLAGQHVVIKGDVVYSNPGHGVGVRFHRLSDETRELMERELPHP